MRKIVGTIALSVLVASCSGGGSKVTSTPKIAAQLAECPALTPLPKPQLARATPVTLPASPIASLMASDASHLGVARTGGGTSCVDVRLMSAVNNIAALQGDRFVAFNWSGYETNGYRADGNRVIDRTTGIVTETGGVPVFSPTGQLFAAAYQSDSAFAGLEGFAVWRVTPTGPIKIATVDDIPEMLDWRVDSWGSETCVNLSSVPFAMVPVGTKVFTGVARTRYTAKQAGATWLVTEAKGGGCTAG